MGFCSFVCLKGELLLGTSTNVKSVMCESTVPCWRLPEICGVGFMMRCLEDSPTQVQRL